MWYGGITRFDVPELKKDEKRTYTLVINLGGDKHSFQLNQAINEK